MLAVAVGAFITQRSRRSPEAPDESDAQETQKTQAETAITETEITLAAPSEADAQTGTGVGIDVADVLLLSPAEKAEKRETEETHTPIAHIPAEADHKSEIVEEIAPLKPILAAEPLSSPHALNSATYTSMAPASGGDSPYAYGNTVDEATPKPEATLLRWSGKTGSLHIVDTTIRGPVTYWSDGPSSTPEPSCIDIRLPVQFPGGEVEIPPEGAASYNEMTPLQRGVYLRWLAEGRIQPPAHACYALVWFFGLERRVLADRLDMGLCIGEAFRLLPLLRWDSLRQGLIKFITWLAAKMWLPEEELLAFSRSLPSVPTEILNMLLRPYSDSRLPLPSLVAFTIMRVSPIAEENNLAQPRPFLHSDAMLAQFAAKYKSKCTGGLVLTKPKTTVFVAYAPTNPTLAGDKNFAGGVLELPDFFKDTENFAPLVAAWKEFLKDAFPSETEPLKALDELESRPDWDSFIRNILGLPSAENALQNQNGDIFAALVMTNLGSIADLIKIERQNDDRKISAGDRKKMSDAARVEGFLIIPHMGIAGKEYRWNEPVTLMPLSSGEPLSQDYNAAALILEYAYALTGPLHTPASMTSALGDYFPLSSEDYARLEALSSVLTAEGSHSTPNNLGESMQFWLQREQRSMLGDFLVRFLSGFSYDEQDWLRVTSALRESLDIELNIETDIKAAEPPDANKISPLELGGKVVQALSSLFTD